MQIGHYIFNQNVIICLAGLQKTEGIKNATLQICNGMNHVVRKAYGPLAPTLFL